MSRRRPARAARDRDGRPAGASLSRLVDALLDGREIDWKGERASRPRLAADLDALRMLDSIKRVHREALPEPEAAGDADDSVVTTAGTTRPMPTPRLGRWGPLELIEKLDEGANGEVFRAFYPALGIEVALKIWRRRGARAEQLYSEAQRLARVRHPNVLRVYGAAESDGQVGMWTELLRGQNLETLLRDQGCLKPREVIEIGLDLCAALTALHAERLVHRDLKTTNVMRETSGRIVLTDFGTATEAEDGDGPRRVEVAGTAIAMAPEQLRGYPPTPVSDIYSLGALLYRLLTRHYPVEASTLYELRRAHDQGRIVALRERRARLPRPLVGVIERALAFDSERRFQSAADVHRALAACLDQRPGRRAPVLPPPGGESAVTRHLPSVPHNLPLPGSSLVGRASVMRRCSALLDRSRLVTLTGPGGVGKTRLAIELAASRLGRHPDGVWFVDLSALSDEARVGDTMAMTLGVRRHPRKTAVESLAAHLGAGRVLVVLDNCEQVLDGCRRITHSLLESCPGLTWLVTSRESLATAGESVFAVPTLSVPAAERTPEVAAAQSTEAVRLFVVRARAAQPGFALTERNVRAVSDVCRKLDGLPFAIELAATQVRMLSPAEISRMLGDRFRLLWTDGPAPSRRLTLRATLEWSYERLSPGERALFVSLAMFPGGWTLESATAVCRTDGDEVALLERLRRLVAQSLVSAEIRDGTTSRYRLLETVRLFASERLDQTRRRPGLEDRLIDHFLHLVEGAEPSLWGEGSRAWFERLEVEHENLLATLDACERGPKRTVQGLALARALSRAWSVQGLLELGRRRLARLLDLPIPEEGLVARARALTAAGDIAALQDDVAAARALFSEASRLSERLHDREGTAGALSGLAHIALFEDELANAQELYERALAIRRAMGDPRKIAIAVNNVGAAQWRRGDVAGAAQTLAEALTLARGTGDRYTLPLVLANGELLSILPGGPPGSPDRLAECLRLVLELKAKRNAPAPLEIVASHASLHGDASLAARLFGAADALRQLTGVLPDQAWRRAFAPHVAAARRALGAGFEREWAAGRGLAFESAIREALASLERAPATE